MKSGIARIFTALLLIAASKFSAQDADSTVLHADSLHINELHADSIADPSELPLEYTVYYFGKDSTVMDVENGLIHLYKDAYIKYGDLEVRAAYIRFSFKDQTLFAKGVPDSTGALTGRPVFIQGDTQFDEDSAAYHFRTKRGISYGAGTQEGEVYLHSKVSKRQSNGWIHVRNGLLTTCDHPNPHFSFHLSRAIVIPDDKVVSGPLYLQIGKIPTPIAVPFGFFPNKRESTHGILLPGYGNGGRRGFFLQNLGYYIPIQPYLDTRFLFDIYSRGSWNATNRTNYKKIYKYTGSINLSRTVTLNGFQELPSFSRAVDFNVQWTHRQDPKARPGVQFNANVNAGTRTNFRNNLNASQQDFLANTLTSAIQWSRSWKNASLAATGRHSQNTQSGQVDITLPSLTFNRNRFDLMRLFTSNPVSRNQIGISYSSAFDNLLSAPDTLFNWQRVDDLAARTRNGVRHQLSASTAFGNLIKISPSINYTQVWGFRELTKRYDATLDSIVSDTTSTFLMGHTVNAGITASTRIYGTFNFDRPNFRAIRHVITPAVGFSYTPYSSYDRTVHSDDDSLSDTYNPWLLNRYAPSGSPLSASVTYSLGNSLEAKFRDRSQAKVVYKKVAIIENLQWRGNYNLAADSLNWSAQTVSAFTTILKNGKLSYSSSYSLYDRDSLGHKVNRFLAESQGKLVRMENTSLAFGFDLSSALFKRNKGPEVVEAPEEGVEPGDDHSEDYVNMNTPWSLRLDYNLQLRNTFLAATQADDLKATQTLTASGGATLFRTVSLSVNSGWDFEQKDLATTMLAVSVDLHCWQFTGTWIPFGERKSYMVQLNIKSPLLRDLKIQKRGYYGDSDNLWQ